MKNAIILHGTGDKPTDFWFPYLKEGLKKQGYEVWLPSLPNAEYPNLKDWIPFILQNGKFTNETIIIGHSAGAQIILHEGHMGSNYYNQPYKEFPLLLKLIN